MHKITILRLLAILALALALTGCQSLVQLIPQNEVNQEAEEFPGEQITPESILGEWQGTLKIMGAMKFDVVVRFVEQDGDISGTIDIPSQGSKDMPLTNIEITGDDLNFEMPSNLGAGYFKTQLQDGKLVGNFEQGKYKGQVELQRVDGTAEVDRNPSEMVEDLPYLQEDVTIHNGDITLAGTLTMPEGDGPFPAAILLSGSGPQDRNGEHYSQPGYRPFEWIADHLTRAGIAVLRYDDRAVGASVGGDRITDTTLDFATDAEAVFDYLVERPEINPDQIGYIGHSEGTWIAAIAASENPEVAFIVSLGGYAVPGGEAVQHSLELAPTGDGFTEEEKQRQLESNKREIDLISAQDWEGLEEFLYTETLKIFSEDPNIPASELEAQTLEATQRQLESRKGWFYYFVTENPADYWQKVQSPVLALWGDQDNSTDPVQNLPPLEAALTRAGNLDVTTIVIPNTGHLFLDAESVEYQFAPGLLETIAEWIAERTVSAR